MKFGLIGEKLGHSYSREIHEYIADYGYELREIPRDSLGSFIESRDFLGINVTIPYKQSIIPLLDDLDAAAKSIGAVNTVVNISGKLKGYNTDFSGLAELIRRTGIDIGGKKVLILGTGGTSNTAKAVSESMNAREIIKISRSSGVTYEDAMMYHSDADIIINTTPCGMHPNVSASPIRADAFGNLSGVIDVIYNPLRTELIIDAESRGIPCSGGLFMLCAQAEYASALFTGRQPDAELSEKCYRKLLHEKQNIVLIGMPTSGKTAVGRIIAEKLGKSFYDADDAFTDKFNLTPADCIRHHGERAFRDAESKIISELSLKTGCVIATGGGAVLRDDNVRSLKHNGRIFMLDRPLGMLTAASDRPLSSDKDSLSRLFGERYSVYKKAADTVIDASLNAETVAAKVIEEFFK